MEDLWCYDLLRNIHQALKQSDAPEVMWDGLQTCVKIEECLVSNANRIQSDLQVRKHARMSLNTKHTVTLDLSKDESRIVADIVGTEATEYKKYLYTIQKAINDTMGKK